MTQEEKADDGTKRDRRPWRAILAAGVVLTLLAGGLFAYAAVTGTAAEAPASAFRFDEVYVRSPAPDAANDTPLEVDVWFSNTDEAALPEIRIVAVAIESQRGLVVSTAERKLGGLDGRTTTNVPFDLLLNESRSYRIELLVLVDGFLAAKGYGSLGYHTFYHGDLATSALRVADGFQFTYTIDRS